MAGAGRAATVQRRWPRSRASCARASLSHSAQKRVATRASAALERGPSQPRSATTLSVCGRARVLASDTPRTPAARRPGRSPRRASSRESRPTATHGSPQPHWTTFDARSCAGSPLRVADRAHARRLRPRVRRRRTTTTPRSSRRRSATAAPPTHGHAQAPLREPSPSGARGDGAREATSPSRRAAPTTTRGRAAVSFRRHGNAHCCGRRTRPRRPSADDAARAQVVRCLRIRRAAARSPVVGRGAAAPRTRVEAAVALVGRSRERAGTMSSVVGFISGLRRRRRDFEIEGEISDDDDGAEGRARGDAEAQGSRRPSPVNGARRAYARARALPSARSKSSKVDYAARRRRRLCR